MDHQYTFVLNYEGGTYVHQVSGCPDTYHATARWCEAVESDVDVPLTVRQGVSEAFKYDYPAPLAGLDRAWCLHSLIEDKSALVNVVQQD